MTQLSDPLPKTPSTARGQRTRQRLLEAAEAELAEHGYEGASVAGIVARGQVAQGTFYVYFPDKKSIFVEVVDLLGVRLRRFLNAAVAGCRDRLAVERAGLAAFLDFCAQHRGLSRIVAQARFVDEECHRRYYRSFADGYARGLKSAMERGALRRLDPEITAHCLIGLADLLGQGFLLWQPGVRRERLVDSAMEFIAHGLAPTPAKPMAVAAARPARKPPARKKSRR